MKTETIAKIAHDIKIVLHKSHGDYSIPAWENLTDDQREGNVKGVDYRIKNTSDTPVNYENLGDAYTRIVDVLKPLHESQNVSPVVAEELANVSEVNNEQTPPEGTPVILPTADATVVTEDVKLEAPVDTTPAENSATPGTSDTNITDQPGQ